VVENKRMARRTLGVVAMLALVLGAALAVSGSAAAQVEIEAGGECFVDRYGPRVCPSDTTKDPDTDVDADVLERGSSSRELPFTGADLTLFVVTGGALVATGALVVRRARAGRNES
jgi:hypothetical protein